MTNLEQAVIDAAIRWHTFSGGDDFLNIENALEDAIDALLAAKEESANQEKR